MKSAEIVFSFPPQYVSFSIEWLKRTICLRFNVDYRILAPVIEENTYYEEIQFFKETQIYSLTIAARAFISI